jgi:hypothetical protein
VVQQQALNKLVSDGLLNKLDLQLSGTAISHKSSLSAVSKRYSNVPGAAIVESQSGMAEVTDNR